jgi:hypothetical protein
VNPHLLIYLVAVAACCLPTAWLATPAAILLVAWLPGRLVLACLRLDRSTFERLWCGIAASIALVPVPLAWLWRLSNDRWAILATLGVLNLGLLIAAMRLQRRRRSAAAGPAPGESRPFPKRTRLAIRALIVWVSACVFGSIWLPEAGGRDAARAAHDYVKHHAMMLSLSIDRLPLRSPFYAADASAACYYYEYHYYIPVALRKLSGDRISIGLAFALSSGLLAAAFLAVSALLALELTKSPGAALLAAACTSVIGGWDIVPIALRLLWTHQPVIVLDSWAPLPWRIHNLATQLMWCPQHMAALLTLLLGCLWLSRAPRAGWWILLAPLMAASSFGSSAYLALVIFVAAAAHIVLQLGAGEWSTGGRSRYLAGLACIAVIAAVLMASQAAGYREMSQRFPGGLTARWDRFSYAVIGRIVPPGPLANYLDAPWLLLIDLGLPALACVLVARSFWARAWSDAGARLLIITAVVGTFAMFTLRSDIHPFDYSFRIAIHPLQVLAACAAGALLCVGDIRPWARRIRMPILVGGVALGAFVGFYEIPAMAIRGLLAAGSRSGPPEHGAIRFLRTTPAGAVVQGDPISRIDLVQRIDRRMGVAQPDHAHVQVFAPPDPAGMRAVYDAVTAAFETPSTEHAHRVLGTAHITHILAGAAERGRFGEMAQFEDSRWFRCLYRDAQVRIYEPVTEVADATVASQPTTGEATSGDH